MCVGFINVKRHKALDTTKALIFANGDIDDGAMVRRALAAAGAALMIAADGGARIALEYGVQPQVVIGDMDSVEPQMLAALESGGSTIIRYPEAKNETDLELALIYAVEQGATWVRVIGAQGGRLDQTLSNVYLLALEALHGCDARLVAGDAETLLLIGGEVEIIGAAGDTVSLVPASGSAHGVSTEGLRYPLRDESLLFGPARGVSNVMEGERAVVRVRDGALIVVHTVGRA
jgi:thiamine pyrophosphokinase